MSKFDDMMLDIGEALKDLSTLDVLTIKGTIAADQLPKKLNFNEIFNAAKTNPDGTNGNKFKIIAVTESNLDGDLNTYYDEQITPEEIAAHQKLCESADAKRAAVIQIFSSAILDAIKKIS